MRRPLSTFHLFAGATTLAFILGMQSIASQLIEPPTAPMSPPRPTVAALPANLPVTDANSERVSIHMASDRVEVSPGDLITLTIDIQNSDKSLRARGVEARLQMPAWLDLVSASATQGRVTLKNHTIKNHTGAIKPEKSARVIVIARLNRQAAETKSLLTAVTLVYREGSGTLVTRFSEGPVFRMR